MTLYKNKYRVESARLPGWDYSRQGYYFITVCTYDRQYLFGNIKNGKMYLNEYGNIILDEWNRSFTIRRELIRDDHPFTTPTNRSSRKANSPVKFSSDNFTFNAAPSSFRFSSGNA